MQVPGALDARNLEGMPAHTTPLKIIPHRLHPTRQKRFPKLDFETFQSAGAAKE
jgi:hypothetical protein